MGAIEREIAAQGGGMVMSAGGPQVALRRLLAFVLRANSDDARFVPRGDGRVAPPGA